jgi:hypothetical protein
MAVSKRAVELEGRPEVLKFIKSLPAGSPLLKSIDAAKRLLKEDPAAGEHVEKNHWPKLYVKNYSINNLFRYELPEGYRMIYTIIRKGSVIKPTILDILDHTAYDHLFGYRTS